MCYPCFKIGIRYGSSSDFNFSFSAADSWYFALSSALRLFHSDASCLKLARFYSILAFFSFASRYLCWMKRTYALGSGFSFVMYFSLYSFSCFLYSYCCFKLNSLYRFFSSSESSPQRCDNSLEDNFGASAGMLLDDNFSNRLRLGGGRTGGAGSRCPRYTFH